MSHTIKPSEDSTYIIITVKGDITAESAMEQNLEAHALGKRLGINLFLVDVTGARNVDNVSRNFDFAYNDMQTTEGIDRSARVATLVSPGDHSHDFMETVARNAGLFVRIFSDPDLAVQYLLEGVKPGRDAKDEA